MHYYNVYRPSESQAECLIHDVREDVYSINPLEKAKTMLVTFSMMKPSGSLETAYRLVESYVSNLYREVEYEELERYHEDFLTSNIVTVYHASEDAIIQSKREEMTKIINEIFQVVILSKSYDIIEESDKYEVKLSRVVGLVDDAIDIFRVVVANSVDKMLEECFVEKMEE